MTKKKRLLDRGKIVFAMLASYLLVSFMMPRVFVANTPEVQMQFLVWAKFLPQRVYSFISNPLDGESRNNKNKTIEVNSTSKADMNYTPIMKGVSAAKDSATGMEYAKIAAGTELEIQYLKRANGQLVKVYVPVSR